MADPGMFSSAFCPSDGVLVSERRRRSRVPNTRCRRRRRFSRTASIGSSSAPGCRWRHLALFDAYPDWKVDVDGASAPLMRANGLFRAVHLARGTHVVTFTYHPSALYLGAQISGVTALVLAVACLWERRRK